MREFEAAGHKYALNERDYKLLLRRFDLSNISSEEPKARILVPCICKRYKLCKDCPLGRFYGVSGCMDILKRLELSYRVLMLNRPSIGWWSISDDVARIEISAIRGFLLGLERK